MCVEIHLFVKLSLLFNSTIPMTNPIQNEIHGSNKIRYFAEQND